MKYGRTLLILSLCSLLLSCGSNIERKKAVQTYEVKREAVHKSLHFTGTIKPLRESALASPMDAVVESMHYHYGQEVKKGDVVVTLNSNELQKQYNDTLTEYLKAKDNFTVAQAKFHGTEELWQAGLLAKNNYLSEKSGLATAKVGLIQATHRLTEMLEKMDDSNPQDLSELSIAEFTKVRQALTGQHNLIHLKAPSDGVLLYPPKGTDDQSAKLSVGSAVKSGQVIALVGDLTGVSVEIDIPEIDIDKIHPGMLATVTGVAIGTQSLKGELVAVNAQAITTTGGTLPSFSAIVEVKQLNESQRAWVKVGMSASIELAIDDEQQLLVPITAIKQEKGQAIVKVQAKNGVTESRVVITGAALADKVVIASGLQVGEVVVYD